MTEDGKRKLDPEKAEAFRQWPEPKSLDDPVSFRAYVNFVREFILNLHEHEKALRPPVRQEGGAIRRLPEG